MAQMALRFILNNPDVGTIIPGMRKRRNVEANITASTDGPLPRPSTNNSATTAGTATPPVGANRIVMSRKKKLCGLL